MLNEYWKCNQVSKNVKSHDGRHWVQGDMLGVVEVGKGSRSEQAGRISQNEYAN